MSIIYISKYSPLGLYNVTYTYVFRIDHLVLDNLRDHFCSQFSLVVCSSLHRAEALRSFPAHSDTSTVVVPVQLTFRLSCW